MNSSVKTNNSREHLLALISYFALFPLVYFIPELVAPLLPDSKVLNVAVVLAIIVPIFSYIVMPIANKILGTPQDSIN